MKGMLLAGGLVLLQALSLLQLTLLRDRIVQLEAGVEFWEYGQGACQAPAQGDPAPDGGLAILRPDDLI